MLNHVMLGSNDIERSRKFYDATLGLLGSKPGMTNTSPSGHVRLFYSHGGGPSFSISQPIDGQPATFANGGTIGFKCDSPEQVKEFHDVAVANGGTSIEGAPGPRGDGAYHLAYVRDPDGNKLCAIYK